MSWTIDEHPTALQYFASLVQSDENFALMEAAISIAQDAEPDLDLQAVMAELDRLQVRLQQRLSGETDPLRQLSVLNKFFYGELGFAGNLNNYYDPANSYIHHVLDPLTGESHSANALAERLQPFLDEAGIQPEEAAPLGLYLQAASARDIVERMLRNLQEIHQSQRDWDMLVAVINRLMLLQPGKPELLRERGMAYAQGGVNDRALADLERYAQTAPESEIGFIQKTMNSLRKVL